MSSEPPVYQTLRPMFDHLRGPRVVLRPYQLDDALALFEAISESRDHLRPWESFADAFQTLDETRDWILQQTAHWLLREWFYIGIWQQEPSRYLGGLWLGPRGGAAGWRIPAFELAYWLRVTAVGQGYVTESIHVLLAYAFDDLGAQRVELGIDAKNARSIAVAERLGFVLEGRLRNIAREDDGTLVDDLMFAVTPTDPRQ